MWTLDLVKAKRVRMLSFVMGFVSHGFTINVQDCLSQHLLLCQVQMFSFCPLCCLSNYESLLSELKSVVNTLENRVKTLEGKVQSNDHTESLPANTHMYLLNCMITLLIANSTYC